MTLKRLNLNCIKQPDLLAGLLFFIVFSVGISNSLFSENVAKTYFIDQISGSDLNNGLSMNSAWQSINRVNLQTYQAGDSILFKVGGSWTGTLTPKGSGSSEIPIVISSYGVGDKPIIDAQGAIPSGSVNSASIWLYNLEYWKIENLKIQNYASDQVADPKLKYGILIEGKNCNTLHGFHINNMEICNVNGIVTERENGGLAFIINRSTTKEIASNFDGITIENCYFHDVANCGLFTNSEWKNRDISSKFGELASNAKLNEWYPSYNIVVRYNRFENTAGNGMVIRIADGPVVEHNTFYKCGLLTTGNASYPYNCDNALWQFNEASYTVYNDGDVDASGFDSDFFCKNTIIQYNYSHDNDWGSVLVCCDGGIDRAFNDGTIIRYNIFQNDGHHMVRTSGNTTNTSIYNNMFYIGEKFSGMTILWHKKWGAYSDKTSYSNNIFYVDALSTTYNFESSTNNTFSNNIFYGKSSTNQPSDPFKISSNPMLVDPGKGDFGFGSLSGYQLKEGSPAIGAGKRMTTGIIYDFYGNEILQTGPINIGVYQAANIAGIAGLANDIQKVNIFQNPTNSFSTINIQNQYFGKVNITLISTSGQVISKFSFNKNSELVSRVIDLTNLDAGLYFVRIEAGNLNLSKQIIKL